MRLAVDSLRRFLARSFGKAEYLARLLVEPVAMVGNPVLVLDLLVLPMSIGHRFCGQAFHAPVVVHKEWHRADPPSHPRSLSEY
jgi:hypothetical protein